MKIKLRILGLFCAVIFFQPKVFSQVTLTFKGNSPYQFKPDQSWNLTIVNPSTVRVSIILDAKIKNRNGLVAELSTTPFDIMPGVNSLLVNA